MNAIPVPPPDAAYVHEHPLTKFMYYSFESNQYYYWNNTEWVAMGSGGSLPSNSDVYLFSESVSLIALGTHHIALPAGKVFFPNRCGFIVKQRDGYENGVPIEWSFGTIVDAAYFTSTLEFFTESSHEIVSYDLTSTELTATTNLTFTVVTPASAVTLSGVAFFKGLLMDI